MAEAGDGLLDRLERWGKAAENAALVLLLTSMMILAVGQIVLRLFFSIGFVWVDELISMIVLWIAIVASIAAARSDRHLRIDALSHFVVEKYARYPRMIVDGFASGICFVLAWHAYRYILLQREFADTVITDVPAWIAYAVVPVAFLLMGYRFFLMASKNLVLIARGDSEAAE